MTDLAAPFLPLAIAGLVSALAAFAAILLRPSASGSALMAAALAAGFAAFTAVTIAAEGVMPVIANHTRNLWGVQVWWDLLFSVSLAFFFAAPRARAAGMNVPAWGLFVVSTASIGLLAMAARLFWLEQARAGEMARA